MSSQQVRPEQRFSQSNPCPICRGHKDMPHRQALRCWGFMSDDGEYAHCSREEQAGQLERNPSSSTFAHRLEGDCHCGVRHGNEINNLSSPISRETRDKTLEATYDYRDEDGKLAYQVLKYRDKHGKKEGVGYQKNSDGG
mgnify:CR=1 FL=1